MRIDALTVCVNYADKLERSIERWLSGLATLTVASTPEDVATANLASKYGVPLHRTDAFTRHGAWFNKGLAQEEAWDDVPKMDWLLLIDADVIPPEGWSDLIAHEKPRPGLLYGCWRYDERGARIADDLQGYGYFQLFHSSDPLAQKRPFFSTDWVHAGNGDSDIMLRWRNARALAPPLPIRLEHPGGWNHNWFGVGNDLQYEAAMRERRRRGGGWKSLEGERLTFQGEKTCQ